MNFQSLSLAPVHRSRRPLSRDAAESSLMNIGTSVGASPRGHPGTIGFYAKQPHVGEVGYLVSCRHVLKKGKSSMIQCPAARDADDPFLSMYQFPLMIAPPIMFDGATNIADCACARLERWYHNLTPLDGYGRAAQWIVAPKVGMTVKKYGRTTELTTGRITAVGATQNVTYGSKVATFREVIVIEGLDGGVFCKGGDSGSLVVDSDNNPVAMLFGFAGSGRLALCNPLGLVLETLGLEGLEIA